MSQGGTVVVLAAGQGKRMQSALPKVLHEVCGRPLLGWVLDGALALRPKRIVCVIGHGGAEVQGWLERQGLGDVLQCVVQEPQLGTGHALQVAAGALDPADTGPVYVLYGDMPCLRGETLTALSGRLAEVGPRGCALLTVRTPTPRGFGRIVRGADGKLARIVEERDATPEERAIDEVNVGVYAFGAEALLDYLPRLKNDNEQGEYYLTDVVGMLVDEGRPVTTSEVEDLAETIGVNNLAHLAEARAAVQMGILERHLAAGVAIEDPSTTYIDHGVEIGAGTRILPCTVIRGGVRIGAGCEVGPFTQLRVGTVLHDGAEVGNFTECKKSELGPGVKAKHLSYLGDTIVGERTNIGAGTIFANYDGTHKHTTTVGARAFVGSGTIVVAPNTLGDGSTTGAGAVITRGSSVGAGETWVGVPARRLEDRSEPSDAGSQN